MDVTAFSEIIINGTAFSADGDVSNPLGVVDFWILKLAPNGDLLWEKSLGGTLADQGNEILVLNDGNYLAVGEVFSNDVNVTGNHGLTDSWIVKLDPSGNIIWETALGGSMPDYALGAEEAPDGSILVVSNTLSDDGNVSEALGGIDVWFNKLDAQGHLISEKSLGFDLNDIGNDITRIGQDIYIVGTVQVDHLRHGNTDVYTARMTDETLSSEIIPLDFSLDIFPNPVSETLNIISEKEMANVSLYDVAGRQIITREILGFQARIPRSGFAPGSYFLKVEFENGQEFTRLVVFD